MNENKNKLLFKNLKLKLEIKILKIKNIKKIIENKIIIKIQKERYNYCYLISFQTIHIIL